MISKCYADAVDQFQQICSGSTLPANQFGNLSNRVSWLSLGRSQVIYSTN
jgi:hypothetical protein